LKITWFSWFNLKATNYDGTVECIGIHVSNGVFNSLSIVPNITWLFGSGVIFLVLKLNVHCGPSLTKYAARLSVNYWYGLRNVVLLFK
jgi:hypothetical protein